MLVFKAWRKSPALTQETTPSQRRITRMLSEAQQAAAAEMDAQLPRVAELLSRGRVNEVANMLPMDPWVDVQEPLAYELLGELLDAGSRVRLPVLQKAELVFSFDRGRPESAAWAWSAAGQLIVQITQEQRGVVQQVVSQAATGAPDWSGVSRQVRNTIGLTAQQAGWVTNHYDRAYTTAIRNGASSAQAAALASQSAARYQTSVHRYRANTIARTETMRAASEGRQQAWGQGMTQGFIDPLWQKEWIAEGDACDICQAIDGQRIGVKDSFPVGEPPAHPNCRCDVLLVPPKPQPQPQGGGLLQGFPAEEFIPELFSGPPSLSTPAPDKPEPTFIGMPSGVFIGMPRVVTFASILDDAREMAEAAMERTDGDPLLGEIYKRRGYDGLPTVVDDDAFDALVDGGATPLYRGVHDVLDRGYLDDLRGGEYYPGLGVYGNGTYASAGFDEAYTYAKGASHNVLRMVLSPGSNVVSYDDLRKEWLAYLQSDAYLALNPTQQRLVDDIGRYAVARGYDAIDVHAGADDPKAYWVILNRSRLTVSATNGLGPRNIYSRDLENAWYAFVREDPMLASTYGLDGMEAWAWDQGYRYIHQQTGRVKPIARPDE